MIAALQESETSSAVITVLSSSSERILRATSASFHVLDYRKLTQYLHSLKIFFCKEKLTTYFGECRQYCNALGP